MLNRETALGPGMMAQVNLSKSGRLHRHQKGKFNFSPRTRFADLPVPIIQQMRQNARSMISPALLIEGYLHGVFPMGMEDGEIGWFSPDPRAIIPLDDGFHVPHGLKRTLNRGTFDLRVNQAFETVMRAC